MTKTYWGISIPMRDETRLAADFFVPETPAYPIIVVRTPYGRQSDALIAQARYFARHGYGVLNVDVRGRGDSEGDFVPYRNEGKDGYDTIEWAAEQRGCNGAVGTLGGSYLAKVQWLAALEQPPHLRAMIPLVSPSDPFVEWPTGTPVPHHLCWLFLTSGRMVQNTHAVDWNEVYQHLPLLTMDEAAGRISPMWREECAHPYLDAWWQETCYQTRFAEIDLPMLHISGWYDDEQIGTPLNYLGMTQSAPSASMRAAQRLIMGPWPHRVNEARQIGSVDFGPDAIVDLPGIQLRFFDRWLKMEQNGLDAQPPVNIFVMGENQWRQENEWPLARTRYTRWYFHADGELSRNKPTVQHAVRTYRYDPGDPVPFITEPTSEQIGGPDDYREIHQRDDVLVYTSAALDQPLEVTGPVKVELFARSSAPDTDFMAQLHDVWPDGFTQRLCDGMVRVRLRDGVTKPTPYTPNTLVQLEIDCWNTAHVFLPGHRICVHITSSAFPKYDRHLNTVDEQVTGVTGPVATQAIYHDTERPSAIILPEIPR